MDFDELEALEEKHEEQQQQKQAEEAARQEAEAVAAEQQAAEAAAAEAAAAEAAGAKAAEEVGEAYVRPSKNYPVAIFERLRLVAQDRKPELQALPPCTVQIVVVDGEAGGGSEASIAVEVPAGEVARRSCHGADLTIKMMDADFWGLWRNALSIGGAFGMGKMHFEGARAQELAVAFSEVMLIRERRNDDPPEWDGLKPPPARGKFVPTSTGRAKVGKWEPQLAKLSGKLKTITPYKDRLEAKPRNEFHSEMDKIKEKGPVGHYYGLEFPYTLKMIHSYGKEWLTKALQAAGTMSKSNKVTKMEIEPFVGGSMSMKCFLHCEYEKEEAGLHKSLFCKYPFPCESEADRKTRYISRFLLNNDGPELDFARILSAGAPMRCVKYYYGDICLNTATVILITEKLELPSHTSDYGPYELEPIPYKSVDYLLEEPVKYYAAMTANVAKLAAWGWSGKLPMNVFSPPEFPTAYFMGTKKRCQEVIYFVRENAPQLFPEGICDAWFESTLLEVMGEVERAQKDILAFLFADEKYCGFTHENMNTDNAIFWRDEAGNVESGFIDWGRFKRNNLARGLTTGYMCTDLCEMMQASDKELCKRYVEEYIAAGGPKISVDTFWEHYLLSWCLLGLLCVDLPHQIWIASPYTGPEGWKNIADYKDPRVFHMPNYNNGNIAMLRNFVFYWKYKDLPSFWKAWRRDHPAAAAKAKAKSK